MNTKQIKEFLVIAEEQQITAAAKRLHMAQPPLSYQMKQLEKELGTELFFRNSYGIQLTDAGKVFRRYAQQIVNLTESATEAVNQEESGESGTIKLGLISSASNLIPNTLTPLIHYYPKIKLEIIEANTPQLIQKLSDQLVDFAIVRSPFNARGLNRFPLYNDQMVAIADPGILKTTKESLSIKELAHQPLIIYRRFETIFNDTFARHGITPFYAAKCDDARTAIAWANAGLGISLVPGRIAQNLAKKPLYPIKYDGWHSQIELVWPRKKHLRPVVRHFIELFQK